MQLVGDMFDAELGQIFISMRALAGLSLWDMARAVGGEPTVVANLEAGAIGDLPPWPELVRLVDGYAHLSGIDPQPILARLQRVAPGGQAPSFQIGLNQPNWGQTDHGQTRQRLAQGQNSGYSAPTLAWSQHPQPLQAEMPPLKRTAALAQVSLDSTFVAGDAPPHPRTQPAARRLPAQAVTPGTAVNKRLPRGVGISLRRGAGSTGRAALRMLRTRSLALVLFVVLPAALALSARQFPGLLYAAVMPLPPIIGEPLRSGVDHAVALLAPVRDGLTWIDVGDPGLRKSDRLPAPPEVTGVNAAAIRRVLPGR